MNVADGLFTVKALSTGAFSEINPLMSFVIDTWGLLVFLLAFKVAYPLICMAAVAYGVYVRAPHIKKALTLVAFLYFCLTLWHIYLSSL